MNNKILVGCVCWMALAVLVALLCFKGEDTSPLKLDSQFSGSLRNLPSPVDAVSEFRIYKTDDSNFLRSSAMAKLTPVKVLSTKSEIAELFAAMVRVHGDGKPWNLEVDPQRGCYHLIALNLDRTRYGYLKVQIGTDSAEGDVAKVQVPDGTNSYEFMSSLPEKLEKM